MREISGRDGRRRGEAGLAANLRTRLDSGVTRRAKWCPTRRVPQGTDNAANIADPHSAVVARRIADLAPAKAKLFGACRHTREDRSAVMAFTYQDRYAPRRFSLSGSLAALIAVRQRQAEERLAAYLRGLPDDVIRKLGLSPADMEKLRRRDNGQPPGLFGRVSIVSALRSARF